MNGRDYTALARDHVLLSDYYYRDGHWYWTCPDCGGERSAGESRRHPHRVAPDWKPCVP